MNKMRRLSPPPQPWWETLRPATTDLPAVRVQFGPIGPKTRELAARASREVLSAAPEHVRDELGAVLADSGDQKAVSVEAADLLRDIGDAASRVIIRHGILAWEGLGGPDEDDDQPIAVTPETIEWFLADDDLFQAADLVYVAPDALRQAEKNASSGSPSGTSRGATPDKDTAGKSARPTKKAAASRTPRAKAKKPAKAAPTS